MLLAVAGMPDRFSGDPYPRLRSPAFLTSGQRHRIMSSRDRYTSRE